MENVVKSKDYIEGICKRERIAGKDYGNTFNGMYYKHLEYITEPVLRHVDAYYHRYSMISIADFGGGSGIVGGAIKRSLKEKGYKSTLIVIDVNKNQLEGVGKEAGTLGVRPVLKNFFDFLQDDKERFDVISMRNVLNYMDREQNYYALKSAYNALRMGGIYVNSFLFSPDEESQKAMNKFYGIQEGFLQGKYARPRHLVTLYEIWELFLKTGFFRIECVGTFTESIPVRGKGSLAEKHIYTTEESELIENYLYNLPDSVKKALNICRKKNGSEDTVFLDSRFAVFKGRKIKWP